MANQIVESILNLKLDYSSLSAEESFTLSDILAEKDEVDQFLLRQEILKEDDDFEGYFENNAYDEYNEYDRENSSTDVSKTTRDDDLQKKKQLASYTQQKDVVNDIPKDKENEVQSVRFLSQLKSQEGVSQQIKPIDRCKRIQNLTVPPLSQIKNICFIVLNNVTAAFDNTAKGVGIPTVITSNGIKYLVVGTSFGNVVLFEAGKGKKVLGTAQNRKYGPITSISISRQGRYLVCGQQNGLITIWDLYNFTEIKKELATQAKIIKILFCSENQFILADTQGNVLLFTIENYFWVKIKRDRLFQKSQSIFYDLKTHTLQSGIEVIVLCSLDQILVATYKPKIQPIDRLVRPDDLIQQKLPNVQIGKTAILSIHNAQSKHFQYNDVLCVSWSNHILVYKFMQGVRLEKLTLVYRFSQEAPIYNMEFMSEGVLMTLDSKETFRSYRIWLNDGGDHKLLNQKLIPEQVIYQRYFRDSNNRYIKLFNNTIISCRFNPKQKELYFICKNSIYRCRIYKWNEYIGDLINNQNKYEEALKICIEIYYRRLDIFLEAVVINEKTLKIFCQVGKIYVEKRIEFIEKLKLDRARNIMNKDDIRNVVKEVEQTYDCIIEYMLEIRCGNQLFDIIYKDCIKSTYIQQPQYYHKFLQCLEPFIMQGRLTSIPSKNIFDEIMQYYLSRGKKELIDHFIMFINVESLSLFYEDAVEVCSQNKLYKSLAYVCATHKDFISPLNILINEVRLSQKNKMENAQETYYAILKDCIIKLLGGCYINGTPFNDQNASMKKSLSNWLMCKETFLFFSKNQVESYHKDYFSFIEELVYLLSGSPTLQTYIHGELKNIMKEDIRGRQIAQLFTKISQIITLDDQQIKIVLNYSDSDLIQKYLEKYLDFYRQNESFLNTQADIDKFYTKNKQLHYLHELIQENKSKEQKRSILKIVDLMDKPDEQLNGQLTRYILNKMNSEDIIWNIEDLLKIHSQNTMIFMLTRFPLEKVNDRLMSIKDTTYRYLVIRKLLKMLRKQNKQRPKDKIKKYKQKRQIKLERSIIASEQSNYVRRYDEGNQSVSQSVTDNTQLQKMKPRRLSKQVMEFYLQCLCKYKHEKRVYYELICNPDQYYDNVDNLIKIIEIYQFNSCLGLLEEEKKNYERAYQHFKKVYKHFFFEQNYKRLMAKNQCHGRFMRRMFEKLLSITQLMSIDGQWMSILKCVIDPLEQKRSKKLVCDDIQDIYAIVNKTHPSLRQLGEIIETCLTEVSNKIPIQTISKFITDHQHVFSKMFVLESLRTTLVKYSNDSKIFHITNEMFINDQVQQFEQIYHNLITGFPPSIRCEECNEHFDANNHMVTYKCGHSYHKVCPQQIIKKTYKNELIQEPIEQEQIVQTTQEQKCPKCKYQRKKGIQGMNEQKIADFHKEQEDSLLLKGMVGIVSIIPNVISAIPTTINVFSSKLQDEKTKETQSEQQDKQLLQDQILSYMAFESELEKRDEQNQEYIRECGKYFDPNIL